MTKIEKVYLALQKGERAPGRKASPALLLLTLIYLVAVLSVPLYEPQKLIWLAAYPIIYSEMSGIGYGKIFLRSVWIIPFLALIAVFNPILDKEVAFHVGGVSVSRGWVSFLSILLRGLLSLQGVVLMVMSVGFLELFNSLRRLYFPSVLCSQLLLTYRYLSLILEEAISMRRARASRGYGRTSYPIKMWGRFIGQLLIRSSRRAVRIHRAMKARGFDGTLPTGKTRGWCRSDWCLLLSWGSLIAVLRFVDFSSIIMLFQK
ncbi:MAG: energy-coupling factor transporter transmembrane protein EcfT [Muribaculaceae bacterium]|nr:energy-coupling factor transporter transmembrane protein EcfT [Muribaculaceae bacterium]